MNDETRDDSDATEASETGPRGGERLRAAREEQQIALLEIAKELHLDEPKLRALERNDFESLGAPVFAKGHMRKYAELVGVDERDVLADYHELTRSAGMPPVVGKRRRPGSEPSPGPWIVLVLALIAVAFAYWWFTAGRNLATPAATVPEPAAREVDEAPAADTPTPGPQTEAGSGADEAPDTESAAEPEADTPSEPADDDAPVSEPIAAEPQAVAPTEPSTPGGVVLTLSFSEDCWTEVTDNSGQRLFFELGRSGTTINVEGVPPLSVLLGSADGVSVQVNGEDYPIRADQRRGRTARLTLP